MNNDDNTNAISGIPIGMQHAMKTLAHASTSLTTRVGALERAIESERLKSLESSSRLLGRIKTLESRLEGSHMQTPGRVASEHRDDREGQPTNVEQWCAFEARIRLELDAGRADAAAARAAASWRGVSDDLLRANVLLILDEMAPKLAIDAAAVASRKISAPSHKCREQEALLSRLTQDIVDAKELATEAAMSISCLDAEVRNLPSRAEMSLLAVILCQD